MAGRVLGLFSNRLFRVFVGTRFQNAWVFFGLIVLSLGVALVEGASFGFFSIAMTGLQSSEATHHFPYDPWGIFSDVRGPRLFILGVFLAILFQLLRSIISYICTVYSMKLAVKIQKKLQSEIYSQILRFSYGYITRIKIGDLLENARAPVYFVIPLMDCLIRVFGALLTAIVILGMMIQLNFWLTIFTLSLFLLFGVIQKSMVKVILKSSDSLSKNLMASNQDASQILQGVKVIHTYFQQKKVKSKVEQRIDAIGDTARKMYTFSNVVPYLNEMFSVIILGSILLFAILFVGLDDSSSISMLLTFLAVSYRFSVRIQNGISSFGFLSANYGYLLRTNEILQDSDKEFWVPEGKKIQEPIETLEFKDVCFCYHARKENVLKHVSFTIPKGSVLGIVGLSGSGKTSIIDLMLRLYDPTAGSIEANGVDIRNFMLESWRAKFGVVAQESFLFDETIAENIRFGCAGDPSQAEIEAAAKNAEIHDFICSLPIGYQTTVGERGLRLSGGERQRIALARALLRNPEVLILDEATSNLDSKSEFYIHKVLKSMRRKKTVIMIAHRLSTIVHCDSILVVEHGKLIEQGTHESLLKTENRYSHLWMLQTQGSL